MSAENGAVTPLAVDAPGSGRMARNAFYLVLGQGASMVLSIVISAALGRYLGPADFGVYYLVTTMTVFTYVFAEWGQGQYMVREVARQPATVGALLGSALSFRVAAALAVGVAGLALALSLGYDGRTLGLYAVLMVAYLPLACSQTYGHVFRGHERMDFDALLYVVTKGIAVAVTVPLLVAGVRLHGVIAAQAAAGLAALAVAVWLARRLRLPPLQASRDTVRDLVVGSTPMFAMAFAISIQPYLDAVVMSKLAPPESVGWYGAARNLMNALVVPAPILAAAASPALSRAAGDEPRFRHQLRAALRPLLGLGALAAVGTFLFAEFAVNLVYSKAKFGPAVVILQVFAASLFFLFVDVLLGYAILAAGRSRRLAAAKLGSVALSTGLALVLVPACQARYGNGGIGLVVAFGLCEALMLVACLSMIPRHTLDRVMLFDVLRAVAAAAGTLGVMTVLPAWPPLLALPLCIVVFVALALAVGLAGRSEIAMVRSVLVRR